MFWLVLPVFKQHYDTPIEGKKAVTFNSGLEKKNLRVRQFQLRYENIIFDSSF